MTFTNGVATQIEFKGNTYEFGFSRGSDPSYVLINNQAQNYIVSPYLGLGSIDLSKVVTTCVTNMGGTATGGITLSGYAKNQYVNADISSWDVYNVTSMVSLFGNGNDFDADITKWDVRNVQNMRGMFQVNTVFNQDIGGWDVSSVRNMQQMFQGSGSIFNRDISRWDVSSVTDMSDMFSGSPVFNQDLTSWTSKLCGRDIDYQSFDATTPAWESKNKPPFPEQPNQQIPCPTTPTTTTTTPITNKDSGITFGEGPLGHIATIGRTVKYLEGHCRDFTFTIGSGSSLYTIVPNKAKLEDLIDDPNVDLSKVVTTCVRDMSRLFL